MNKECSILQWNARGLNSDKKNELSAMILNENPFIVCIQETKFKYNHRPNFRGFNSFNRNKNSNTNAHGGVLTLVKENHNAKEIVLQTGLQAIAVKVNFPTDFVICNVYCSPTENFTLKEWVELIRQLGPKFVVVGDLNSKNVIWGSSRTCVKGKIIEDLISNENLCVLNTGNVTHLCPKNGTFSAIDLSLSTNNIAGEIDWYVLNDLHDSDHYPIILKFPDPTEVELRPKWKLNQADWGVFQNELEFKNKNIHEEGINEHELYIRKAIIKAAESAIPKSSGKLPKKYAPWWNNGINLLIRERQTLLRSYQRTGDNTTLTRYNQKRNEVKHIIRKETKIHGKNVCHRLTKTRPQPSFIEKLEPSRENSKITQ